MSTASPQSKICSYPPQAPPSRTPSVIRAIILGPDRLFPCILRVGCLVYAAVFMWGSRGVLDPDGVSYSDLAKALLRGDWRNGFSSYWSPLYSWQLAFGYAVFRPGIHWLIFVPHVINFIGFVAALLIWEWLLCEWERWKGPPAHRALSDAVFYSVIAWTGLHTVGLIFTSADMQVMALTIAMGVILLRLRAGAAVQKDFVFLGAALGFGFLAKAATLALYPAVLSAAALLLRKWNDRRVLACAAVACLVPLPFVIVLSVVKGHFVVNDTGRLNYSWLVTGAGVEGYKESAFWPGNAARHPIERVMDVPRVLAYDSHPAGTFPVHFDPVWWSEGYPVRLDIARQLMVLWSNIGFCAMRFAMCPALWLAIVCCVPGGALPVWRSLVQLWFIWLPALVAIGSYCIVYASNRYLGGAFTLLGFCLLAACWNVRLPQRISVLGPAVILLIFCVVFRAEFIEAPVVFIQGFAGREDPLVQSEMRIADDLQRQGFQAGDKVGLIGNTIMVAWLHLIGGSVIASIPMTITNDDRAFGRPMSVTFEKSDVFWRSDPHTQQRVLNAFRGKGAKWAMASNVPLWANVSGWQVAGYFGKWRDDSRTYMYFKKLN